MSAGLSSLVRLHTLSLSSCALSDVRPLSSLVGLRTLDLSWCRNLIGVRPLSSLVDLRTLDLSFCRQGKGEVHLCDTSSLSALASVRIRLA